MHIAFLRAGNEMRFVDKIGRTDRVFTKTQMDSRDAAGLLRIVRSESLAVKIGVIADDLRDVLDGADGSVGSESEEKQIGGGGIGNVGGFLDRKAGAQNIVVDSDGEMIFHLAFKVFVNGEDLGRGGVAA